MIEVKTHDISACEADIDRLRIIRNSLITHELATTDCYFVFAICNFMEVAPSRDASIAYYRDALLRFGLTDGQIVVRHQLVDPDHVAITAAGIIV